MASGLPLTLCHPFAIVNSLASVMFIFRGQGIRGERNGLGATGFCPHCPQAPMLGLRAPAPQNSQLGLRSVFGEG